MGFGEKLQAHLRRKKDDGRVRPVRGLVADEGAMRLPEDDPHTIEAEVVEGNVLEARPVSAAEASGFTHFLDGVQKTRLALTYDLLPVLRAFAAASVRARGADRRMYTFGGLVRTMEALVMPFDLCPPDRFLEDGIECFDSSPFYRKGTPPADRDHPANVSDAAHNAVGSARAMLERDLAQEWCRLAGPLQWLMVDGPINASLDVPGSSRIVGVIKSHQTRYFTGEEYRRILSLPEGSRTSVFRTRRGDHHSAYSWYLRLREDRSQDPSFGLVRIEARAGQAAIEQADTISGWILAERSPVSLPDSRWDRMIYPIRDCEQYLKAISPTQIEMEARLLA